LTGRTSNEQLSLIVQSMTQALAHRGADGMGVWVDQESGVALGHRRLSVIDLSPTGDQPMRSSRRGHVLVCNGEIYNYRDLKRELGSLGSSFFGEADSEVLLEACGEWGVPKTLDRLMGMYAFALWDPGAGTLHLARDHIGMKPLYWGRFGHWILFGSELKALRRHPAFVASINRDAVAGLMAFNYIPSPLSIYDGVCTLKPGHFVAIDLDGNVEEREFWSLEAAVLSGARQPECDPVSAADELERRLRASVARHMVADVPVASLLSGGVDSSLVTALMQQVAGTPVRSYAVRFADPEYDEADHARAVASHLGTDHTEIEVDEKVALQTIGRLPDIYDEPFADMSQIPTAIVCAEVAHHGKVVLTGDGGDEMFAGYPRYRLTWNHMRHLSKFPAGLRRAVAAFLKSTSKSPVGRLSRFLPPVAGHRLTPDRLMKAARLLQQDDFLQAYRRMLVQWEPGDRIVRGAEEPLGMLHSDWDGVRTGNALVDMRWIDTATYLPDDILVKVDRAGMAAGLEARMPLLDKDVMDFAWRQSTDLCYREGTDKWLLRQVLHRYVPKNLVDRPKMGFGVPMHTWLRGPLRGWAEDLLDPRRMEAEGYLNAGPIQKKWRQHLSGEVNWHYALWPVLMFQLWLRHDHA